VPSSASPTTRVGESSPFAALSFPEHVCLALVVEGVSHGWALGTLLSPGGELGRIWTLSRPLTYRTIDQLVAKELVSRSARRPGRGRDRAVLDPTSDGRRVTGKWLATPVQHLRDVRIELLVKLELRRRVGLDSAGLLAAQLELFRPRIEALTAAPESDDPVHVWRRESARAVRRFLEQGLRPTPASGVGTSRPELRLSARNQLRAVVTDLRRGEVMCTVHAALGDGQPLTAAITSEGADELDLGPGDDVLMIVKSTEVMVAKPGG
jgi:molybdopterin-binding protein